MATLDLPTDGQLNKESDNREEKKHRKLDEGSAASLHNELLRPFFPFPPPSAVSPPRPALAT